MFFYLFINLLNYFFLVFYHLKKEMIKEKERESGQGVENILFIY